MKAHIVGGGFGGLAAAGYLIRHADVPGADITIYEASDTLGGGFFLGGGPAGGYNLPGSVFDSEFRCANELLKDIPSLVDPAVSVKDEFFDFNRDHPFFDRAHIIDRNGAVVHGPRFGLTLSDFWALGRLSFAVRSFARRTAHPGVLLAPVLRDRVLAPVFEHHGLAAAAQRDRVSPLHQSHPAAPALSLGHGEDLAHAEEPVRDVHRTAGRMAQAQGRERR